MASLSKNFQTTGVLRTFSRSIPKHRHFDKPILMKCERYNNSLQHGATIITIELDLDGEHYIVKYSDNGDGKCDFVRYTSPQNASAEGTARFAAGCHYDRLSGDPSSEYKWEESFKIAGEDITRSFEGPFADGRGPQEFRTRVSADSHFKTKESSGMTGCWMIRKDMLNHAVDEAKTSGKELDEVLVEHLSESFGMKYSQEILDKLTLKFRVGKYQILSNPKDGVMPSLETALQQDPNVYRFPDKRVVSGDTTLTYTFYRMKKGDNKLEDYPHYGSRSANSNFAIIQVNPGFGFHTVEDMDILEACGVHGGGSIAALSGCTVFVKCETTATTPSGQPDMSKLFDTMAVKVQVDREDPLVKKHIFQFLKDAKNLPKGWKEANNEKFESAPKYTGEAIPTVLPPSPPPSPVVPGPLPVQPIVPIEPPPSPIVSRLPNWMPQQLTITQEGDILTFVYVEKARVHDMDRDICELASAVSYLIATKGVGDRYSIVWRSPRREDTSQAVERYKQVFKVLNNTRFE